MKASPFAAFPAMTSRRRHASQRLFFPAAALFAALGPWLLLGIYLPGMPAVDIATHAQGMLFGYVGALIAGYLGGRLPTRQLLSLFGLWLAGRWAELAPSGTLVTQLLYAGFGLYLAIIVAPRFAAAKKWRNRMIAPLLIAIACFPLLLLVAGMLGLASLLSLHSLLLLICLLMFFMGGRFITPLLARAYANRAATLPHRVQPALEGTVMLLLLVAAILDLAGADSRWTSLPGGAAGLLLCLRLLRWRLPWRDIEQAALVAMGYGYLWLGLGLVVFSLSLAGLLPATASLHVITIGALGTLSSTVMLKFSHAPGNAPARVHHLVVILLSMAVLARFIAPMLPAYYRELLTLAATLWSANFLLVGGTVLLAKRSKPPGACSHPRSPA